MSKLSQSEINERNKQFSQGKVFCSDCKEFKSTDNFCKSYDKNRGGRFGNFGYRYYCKECETKQRRGKYKNRIQRNYLKKRQSGIDKLVELAGGKCQFPGCDYDNLAVLEFHHVNPEEKTGNAKSMAYAVSGFNDALDEANKCCLLCPNHHREFETGVYKAEFIKQEIGYTIASVEYLDNREIRDRRREAGQSEAITPPNLPLTYYKKTVTQTYFWG